MSRKPAQQGNIVSITLDPTAGCEIRGTRPVLILSNAEFNRNGRALAAPITQGGNIERVAGWAVTLMGSGSATPLNQATQATLSLTKKADMARQVYTDQYTIEWQEAACKKRKPQNCSRTAAVRLCASRPNSASRVMRCISAAIK